MKNTQELYHYGVLGMRWGVRKGRSNSSEDSLKVQKIRQKKVNEMSNQELRDANNRLQLESTYKQLTNKKHAGQKALNGLKIFTTTVTTVTAAVGAYKAGKKLLDSSLNKVGDWVIKDVKFGKM